MSSVYELVSEIDSDDLKDVLDSREAARIAALPVATPEMVESLCNAVRGVELVKIGWLNKTHRLDADAEDKVAIAKAEHRLRINTAEARAEVTDIVCKAKRLTGFKFKASAKGIVFKVSGVAGRRPVL